MEEIARSFKTSKEFVEAAIDASKSGLYARAGYPSACELQEQIAKIAHVDRALLFNCGMAAITTLLTAELIALKDKQSTHKLVVSQYLYGRTKTFFEIISKSGWQVVWVDFRQDQAYLAASQHDVALVYAESFGNHPHMPVTDLPRLFENIKDNDALVVIDNTVLTPALLRITELAQRNSVTDRVIVIESATKYWQKGRNAITAGIAYGPERNIARAAETMATFGTYLQPSSLEVLNTVIVSTEDELTGIMKKHSKNAQQVVAVLRHEEFSSIIEMVAYPQAYFLPDGVGGLVYFSLKGGEEAVRRFCDQCNLPIGGSFGHANTWVEPYGLYFRNNAVRLSVGYGDTIDQELIHIANSLRELK